MTEYYGTRPKKSVFLVAMKASPNPKPISVNEAFSLKLIGLAITYINSHLNHWENHFQIHIYLSTWQHIKTLNTMPPGYKKKTNIKLQHRKLKGRTISSSWAMGHQNTGSTPCCMEINKSFIMYSVAHRINFFLSIFKKYELKLIIFIFNLACSLIFILDTLFCLG